MIEMERITKMDIKKLKYVFGSIYGIYLLIVSYIIFKKPDGWSMMPASWQDNWSPNYFLLFILLLIGAIAAYVGFKVFSKKQQ